MRIHSHTIPRPRPRRGVTFAALTTAILIAVLALAGPASAAPPVSSVSDKLICLCGCNSVLTECPHQDCGWGIPAKEYIRQELETGATPEAVVEYFVAENGEQVLAAPRKSGVNLIAWVLPFVALAIAAVAVYYLVVGWARKRSEQGSSTVATVPVSTEPSDASRRLDEELRDFD